MKVGIVGQRDNDRATQLAREMAREVASADVTTVVDASTAREMDAEGVPVGSMDDCDLVVSIGGDGTFLFAAREAGSVPLLGVNLGEVGFLNAVAPEDAIETVKHTVSRLRETGTIDTRDAPRLRATGAEWSLPPALNEVVIQGAQRGHGNGATFEIRVDGAEYVSSDADGVMVATPTGSTAYNLSEGGPLVHPSVTGLVITEMCAADPMPSLVVSPDHDVRVRVTGADRGFVVSDGRMQEAVTPPETVTVTTSDDPVRIAGPQSDFFEALDKLD